MLRIAGSARPYVVELPLTAAPLHVQVNGHDVPPAHWRYDARAGLLQVTARMATGTIAVVPDTMPVKTDVKAPDWLHGLGLSCRRFDEKLFTKDTRKFGVEVSHHNRSAYFANASPRLMQCARPVPGFRR